MLHVGIRLLLAGPDLFLGTAPLMLRFAKQNSPARQQKAKIRAFSADSACPRQTFVIVASRAGRVKTSVIVASRGGLSRE